VYWVAIGSVGAAAIAGSSVVAASTAATTEASGAGGGGALAVDAVDSGWGGTSLAGPREHVPRLSPASAVHVTTLHAVRSTTEG
jgi:hypothetical protein